MPAILQEAARSNPKLAAARGRWLASRERPTIARSLPDPLVTYTEMVEPVQTRVGPWERSIQVTQRIPFPSKLHAAAAVATEKARVSELEYHVALRDVMAESKLSYYELVYLRRALRIIDQNRTLARQLAEKAAALHAQSKDGTPDAVSLFDTVKAEAELAQLDYDAITIAELARAEEAKLNGILSRKPNTKVGALQPTRFRPLVAPLEQLTDLAVRRRQEIQAALHRVSAAQHSTRLATLSQVPDFSIGLKHNFVGSAIAPTPGSGDDATAVMLGFTLPIWAGKNRAKIAEAQALEMAARSDHRAKVDDIGARLAGAYFKLKNAERLAHLYKTSLIPQAERALEIAEQWRDTGRDTFARLLEARSVWLNFQLAYERALADHEQMVARIEQLVGISLGHLRKETP